MSKLPKVFLFIAVLTNCPNAEAAPRACSPENLSQTECSEGQFKWAPSNGSIPEACYEKCSKIGFVPAMSANSTYLTVRFNNYPFSGIYGETGCLKKVLFKYWFDPSNTTQRTLVNGSKEYSETNSDPLYDDYAMQRMFFVFLLGESEIDTRLSSGNTWNDIAQYVVDTYGYSTFAGYLNSESLAVSGSKNANLRIGGGTNTSQPGATNGFFYIDSSCKLIRESEVASVCGFNAGQPGISTNALGHYSDSSIYYYLTR